MTNRKSQRNMTRQMSPSSRKSLKSLNSQRSRKNLKSPSSQKNPKNPKNPKKGKSLNHNLLLRLFNNKQSTIELSFIEQAYR
mgnify:CR=1 FL=1